MGSAASVSQGGRKAKRKVKPQDELHENMNGVGGTRKDESPVNENRNNLDAVDNKGGNKFGTTDHCIRADKKAAIVVHGCQEEYQTLVDELPEIIMKQLGPSMIAHPMIQGKYCLVRDDEKDEDHLNPSAADSKRLVAEQKSRLHLPICGLSQPSFEEIKKSWTVCVIENVY
ncbi:unnamed protein product [Heterobilharzia americana]|nr:unnamed protein product [Heterobilharzia americana]